MINFILKENSGEKLKLGKINVVKRLLISCKKVEKKFCEILETGLSRGPATVPYLQGWLICNNYNTVLTTV